MGLQSFLAFPGKLCEAALATEPCDAPALAHTAWHPIGAPSAGSIFTVVQKEIFGKRGHGITFTSPPLGRSLQGIAFMEESRPHNSVTVFVTHVREVNTYTILLSEMYFK